jgi:nitroimidazol reductase NimA-like FMN-containing flavoprotein (pyridoxamine 5'-phosphate oxidase superfamily)
MTERVSTPETEHLEVRECWRLLRGVSIGRLGVWTERDPGIFPINYIVDGETVVFRSGDGTKLRAALGGSPVALEADAVDTGSGIAWSVVLTGHASEMERTEETLNTVGKLLFPWHPGQKDHFVRIVPSTVSGRRFTVTPPRAWGLSLDEATRAGLE